jgi:putative ABC transport system ATP-binding protein
VIQLEGVSKTYEMVEPLTVLKGVNIEIGDNEFVAILGASGSGKSTMLHIMGLLDRPSSGSVRFRGSDTSGLSDDDLSRLRGESIGFVFQSFHLIPHLTVAENVELPLFYLRVNRRARRDAAMDCLKAVQLEHRARHLPTELSGGERQRAAVARSLVANAPMVMADEPTGNLDTKTGDEIFDVFCRLHEDGRTVVIITHDVTVASRMPRTIKLSDGEVVEDTGPCS